MANNIEINLGFAKLVVEKGDPLFNEVCIGLIGPNGDYQDIAVVGQDYDINENSNGPIFKDSVSVRVWSDCEQEDRTDEFCIKLAEEFE